MYTARFTSEAVENIKKLAKNARNALKKEFEKKILGDPLGCSEELAGQLAGFRSYHFRDHRVVYRVYQELNVVAVVGVGKKSVDLTSDVYRRLETIASSGKLADAVLKTLRLFSR